MKPNHDDLVLRPAPKVLPTVGRIVYYKGQRGEELAALITDVNTADERIVDLTVFPPRQAPVPVAAVIQGEGPGQWDWMPYQKGQAAKTETLLTEISELEKRLRGGAADGMHYDEVWGNKP